MEFLDLYDYLRRPLGRTIRRGDPIRKGERCLVVHILIYNSRGEILVQRRADDKEFAPGLWALTGGAVQSGETNEQACLRETQEELGFTPDMDAAMLLISFMAPDAFVDVYAICADVEIADLHLQRSEVAEAAWLNHDAFVTLVRGDCKFFSYAYMDLLIWMLDGADEVWHRENDAPAEM